MKNHQHLDTYCAVCEIEQIARLLPHQGPIKDFIHQNTLSAFMDLNFDEAVEQAGEILEARSYMDLGFYRSKFSHGEIALHHLSEALNFFLPEDMEADTNFFRTALSNFQIVNSEKALMHLRRKEGLSREIIHRQLSDVMKIKHHRRKNPKILSDIFNAKVGSEFEHELNQLLFRLLGSFVDQGVSLWPYLNKGSSFIDTLVELAESSRLPLKSWINNQDLARTLKKDPQQSIPEILSYILEDPELYSKYLQEILLAHPGWSGMINIIAHKPQSLSKKCLIDLLQLVAVKLALSWQYIKNNKINFVPIGHKDILAQEQFINKHDLSDILSTTWFLCAHPVQPPPSTKAIELLRQHWLEKVWHRAFENSYYNNVLSILSAPKPSTSKKNITPTFQAVFCIDDRGCSLRRILEQECPEIETFGTAGFYGIDCYLKAGDLLPQQICPAPITPKYLIYENPNPDKTPKKTKSLIDLATFLARHGANSTPLGFVSAYTLGHLSLFSLMASFFQPWSSRQSGQRAARKGDSKLIFERSANAQPSNGLLVGYTEEEMADRVYNTLKNMGLNDNFAPIIFIIGHGSSSVNNPHFAAYDCGACSGRPGAINARVFSAMANKKSVREILRNRGIFIGEDTIFVGGFHDTCADHIEFLDTHNLKSSHQELLQRFINYVQISCEKNAALRCLKFALVPKNISPQKALAEVRHRSSALFEPRPELNHANNALLIVGRRERSYGVNLDRRAFLQSYDPSQDINGVILNTLLSAVVPVCGGINLEYYFSRIDPAIYGCGSKLSHNVCSLIGVGNGLDDDLRTGLPVQMTEAHDPIRLLMIVEQEEDLIKNIIYQNDGVRPWIANSWIKLASLSPVDQRLSFFNPVSLSWHVPGKLS